MIRPRDTWTPLERLMMLLDLLWWHKGETESTRALIKRLRRRTWGMMAGTSLAWAAAVILGVFARVGWRPLTVSAGGALWVVAIAMLGGIIVTGAAVLTLALVLPRTAGGWMRFDQWYFASLTRFLLTVHGRRKRLDPREPGFYLLYLFLPRKDREILVGDLEEEYSSIEERFGPRKARLWFYKQVIASLWPFVVAVGRKLVTWGILGFLGEIARRMIR